MNFYGILFDIDEREEEEEGAGEDFQKMDLPNWDHRGSKIRRYGRTGDGEAYLAFNFISRRRTASNTFLKGTLIFIIFYSK
jgi:hypothetical protein